MQKNENWKNGTINAHELPNGSFVSASMSRKHIDTVRNNTEYRERLERASKMAGYVPPALSLSRAQSGKESDYNALLKQNERAEKLIQGKKDEERNKSNIVIAHG